jgi:regulator of protease activity HflC (stomatin/prohibitin superfamily)
VFAEQSFGMLTVISVQLRAITLQSKLEGAIENKLIEQQAARYWEISQNITMINQNTQLISQWADNNITLIYAEGQANATKILEKAKADALQTEL